MLPVINPHGRYEPIVYVNGILTSRVNAQIAGEAIGALYEAPVYTVWNPTDNWHRDLLQVVAVNKSNTPDVTTALVIKTLRQRLRSHMFVTLIGHSQGAAVVSSALSHLTKAERSRVDVITFGGAALTYPVGARSVRVVVNVQDPVPRIAGYGLAGRIGLATPGLEKVSFGSALQHTGFTHGILDYLDQEAARLGKPSRTPGLVSTTIDQLYLFVNGGSRGQ